MTSLCSLADLFRDENLFDELFQLVQDGLADELKNRLDSLTDPLEYLTTLMRRGDQKINLLMFACLRGNEKIVDVLLTCGYTKMQLEQRGTLVFSNGQQMRGANALYCACWEEHFHISKKLLEFYQVDVNESTDEHESYPLLLQATAQNRLNIVRFLVDNHYCDVNRTRSTNRDQWTALMEATKLNHSAIVQYLIDQGADVNYKCSRPSWSINTPLKCATVNDSFESFCLLWKANANPQEAVGSGEPLLPLAVTNHAYKIANFLLEQTFATPDDLEWYAAKKISIFTQLDEMQKFVPFLEISLQYRQTMGISKLIPPPRSIFDDQQECQTIDELKAIVDNRQRLSMEYLLIKDRLCSSTRAESFVEHLKEFVIQLVSNGKLEQSFDVCCYLAEIDQRYQVHNCLHLFVWLFCRMLTIKGRICADLFLQVTSLALRPHYLQEGKYTVNNDLFIVVMATKVLEQRDITREQRKSIYQWIADLCRLRMTTDTGQTILHLCVNARTSNNVNYRSTETKPYIQFPNRSALQLLLTYGSRWLDIDAKDEDGNTPLHIACQSHNDLEIIKTLYNAGCHIDCVNKHDRTPLSYTKHEAFIRILQPQSTPQRLKCLCARAIIENDLRKTVSHSSLQNFITLHAKC